MGLVNWIFQDSLLEILLYPHRRVVEKVVDRRHFRECSGVRIDGLACWNCVAKTLVNSSSKPARAVTEFEMARLRSEILKVERS